MTLIDFEAETLPRVFLGQRNIPIGAAGAYVPGCRYPLTASAHMTVLTAKVAGVTRIAATTPPHVGAPPPVSIAAMRLAGADEIYVMGGVQAVAALALDTETIDAVDMLAGPGNAYVAEAKRQLFGEVGIDLFAGPTEVLVIADDTADPFVVATDLLSQAEHGLDSPAVLITTSEEVATSTVACVEDLLPGLPTGEVARRPWRGRGEVMGPPPSMPPMPSRTSTRASTRRSSRPIHVRPRAACATTVRCTWETRPASPTATRSSAPTHVLPTLGAARYTGGLWVGKYLKTVTYQDAAASAFLGEVCGRVSRIENFEGHARCGSAGLTWTDHIFDEVQSATSDQA